MFEHTALAEMKARHPDWIWPRSDTHVMLGVPGSLESMKTVVEPGNSFSPGPGSFGVSLWLYDHAAQRLYAPERMALDELAWSFAGGDTPVLVSRWQAADGVQVESRLFADGDVATGEIADYLTVNVSTGTTSADISLYIVLRSCGAAGGPLSQLASPNPGVIQLNGCAQLYTEPAPDAFSAVSYTETGEDIGSYLQQGILPATTTVDDPSTWASGVLAFSRTLQAGACLTVSCVLPVKANSFVRPAPPTFPLQVHEREIAFIERWRAQFPCTLEVPDSRFYEAWHAQLAHLWIFTVADAPRITPISYPIWWLRDGAYVIQALNKGGLHDFAHSACLGVKEKISFGGFGAEGDGPGALIWILTEHYLLTRDEDYLRTVYPHLLEKADLLIRMRHTTTPMRHFAEYVMPMLANSPDIDLLCLPAKDGLIQGRMDWHIPVYWINAFAWQGLTRVAHCARTLGDNVTARRLDDEADALRDAMVAAAPTLFGQNERDVNSALWPSGWAFDKDGILPEVVATFQRFWDTVRCPEGVYTPEPLWTYFGVGQTHNYLYLGEREKVWVNLEHYLTNHTAPGLYTYHEGNGDENSFLRWQQTRGWDTIRYVTPHGWTAAELSLLLRDCLLYEKGDTLVIGAGVPDAWLHSGQPFGISNAPSHFGKVSWHYDPATLAVTVEVEHPPTGGMVIALPGYAC